MRQQDLSRVQVLTILAGASVMLSLSMGMRQSWGLFQPHMIRDLSITAADFSLAIAVQNIFWGITQPFVGALADRHGSRPVAIAGVIFYIVGLLLSMYATSAAELVFSIGICLGLALSCASFNVAMAVTSRAVAPLKASAAMGAVSALGSIGLIITSPLAQTLISESGWQSAIVAFVGLAVVMLPAAFFAGGADKIVIEKFKGLDQSATQAVREAFGHSGYIVMALAFFVCGLQLTFLITHLPTYLAICGMDPMVGSTALAFIGLFNVGGSYLFGWLGGRYSKRVLLGGIYVLRSLCIAAYFMVPPSPTSTLVFAAAMGTLWLGVAPLIGGLVVQLFGLRYMGMLLGVAFFSHQVGSFLGAWGGGLIYSMLGSYDRAWQFGVFIGLVLGTMQMVMNVRPSARVAAEQREFARGQATA
ncbi:MAG: MFS transporter [Betaproteobacteria bacterium]|nr:MFS transporter [Betaproteobacteria bacterium]